MTIDLDFTVMILSDLASLIKTREIRCLFVGGRDSVSGSSMQSGQILVESMREIGHVFPGVLQTIHL
jgi:hypothetical protein